jgi:hypothetical protein
MLSGEIDTLTARNLFGLTHPSKFPFDFSLQREVIELVLLISLANAIAYQMHKKF